MDIFHIRFDGINRSELKQVRLPINILRHPGYDSYTRIIDYDYCLIHLDEEVIPSETVKFIRLADEMPVDGDNVLALGLGRTAYNEGPSLMLKQANFTIIVNTKCELHERAGR